MPSVIVPLRQLSQHLVSSSSKLPAIAGTASKHTIITLKRAIAYLFVVSFILCTSFQVYLCIYPGSLTAALHCALHRLCCICFCHIRPPLSVLHPAVPCQFHTFPAHDHSPNQNAPKDQTSGRCINISLRPVSATRQMPVGCSHGFAEYLWFDHFHLSIYFISLNITFVTLRFAESLLVLSKK